MIVLLLSVAICWGATKTDLIIPDDMITDGITLTDGSYTTFTPALSNVINADSYAGGINSDAAYVGKIGYDATNSAIYFSGSNFLATYESGGKAKSITVEWAGTAAGNTASGLKKSTVQVYASNTPLNGTETKKVATAGTSIGSVMFPGEGVQTTFDIPAGYTHISLVSSNTAVVAFTGIVVEWEPIKYYTITNTDPSHISLSKTSAEAGTTIRMTITPAFGYEVIGYTYGGETVNFAEAEYTSSSKVVSFTMPADDISVGAIFQVAEEREPVDFYFFNSFSDIDDEINIDECGLISGASSTTIYFLTLDTYPASTLTFEVDDESVVEIVSHTYNTSTGIGTVVLRGYKVGDAVLTITSAQTSSFEESVGELSIVVSPLQVVLVAEYESKFYAATTTLSGKDLASQEVIVAGGNVYYDPSGTYDLGDMTWNLEMRIVDDEEIYTLSKSSVEYLRAMGTTEFRFEGSYRKWYLEGGYFKDVNEKGIRYSSVKDAFTATSVNEGSAAFSLSVYPVSLSSVSVANEYSRSLTSGNYATMCLPYAVSPTFLSGVDVFNIVGKHMSGVNVTGIEVEAEEGVLEAGKPYVIQAKTSTLNVLYGAATVVAPVDDDSDGLVGNLSASPLAVPNGCYGLSANQLRKVNGGTATVGQYKAYLDLSEVEAVGGGAPAPGRRVIYAENVATSLEDLLDNATELNWNEPVYNTLGQQVGKGTTGVLIQNGQKFLVR